MSALDELRETFARARAEAEACALPTGLTAANTCRYCGRWWRKWAGSKLDGHSKCIVLPWFMTHLRAFFAKHPGATYDQVCTVLGVSSSVVRSWVMPISEVR